MSFKLFCFLLATALSGMFNQAHTSVGQTFEIKSPDKRTVAVFKTDETGKLVYRLTFDGAVVLTWSRLGLQGKQLNLSEQIIITGVDRFKTKTSFDWPLGENARITNHFNGANIHCVAAAQKFELRVRMYNGSLAFKYFFQPPAQSSKQSFNLTEELTGYNFQTDGEIYQYHEESAFTKTTLGKLKGTSDLPSTLVLPNQLYISIGEAENRNYSKCVLTAGPEHNSLKTRFYLDTIYEKGAIKSITSDTQLFFRDSVVTPWRTISCARNAVDLHQFSELNLKLTTPITNSTPTGIIPGKIFRVPINTEEALKGVDFAKKMNFQYILIDAGWYGAEFRTTSDPLTPIPGMDIQGIINYGKSKGIGVILYVNYVGLKAKLDSILPLYKRWGVSGIKFGFVDGGKQTGLSWLDTAMLKVNTFGMVLNVHDHYKPTGLSRRYPYNLSQEGIRGDENSPDAYHNTVLPFTRFLAGAADFTFCYPNEKNAFAKNLLVSKGQQLALTVVYFDPLQAIFWYGKSEDYRFTPDLDFFKRVPTVWDESHYLAGEIGEFVTVARKKDGVWFVGTAAGLKPASTVLSLGFLDKGKVYKATVYEDGPENNVVIRTLEFKYGEKFDIKVGSKSGQAMILEPKP